MALNLFNLIGQSLGANVPTPEGDPIVVERNRGRPNVNADGPEPPFMGNKQYLEEALASLEGAPKRQGMFGTKGTLRDILGVVGDAFLLQSGNKPMYSPQRQQEKMGDALVGFTNSDEAAAAAVERLAAINPEAAAQLYNNLQTRKAASVQNDIDLLEASGRSKKDALSVFDRGAEYFGQVAGATTPETYSRALPLLKGIKQKYGLSDDEFAVPDEYDPDLMKMYQFGGMKTNQQVTSDISRDRLEQGKELEVMKEEGRNKRYNPPQPRQSRSPTELEYFQQIDRTPPEKRTQGQKDFYKKYTQGTGKKKREIPPLPPGFSIKPK